ncbi:transcription termination factor 1a, mitochondrial isoform X2 [Scleropages formosus]|uniref:Mitochondrial transcription termination factor 1 n=1 Tax=Scleropages formosus TaxID=113540 RepID=A0A8C9RF72_SCLFO|nr:transcription termination factor 1, mitochondrial isoform X2 [Scleropages formosus]
MIFSMELMSCTIPLLHFARRPAVLCRWPLVQLSSCQPCRPCTLSPKDGHQDSGRKELGSENQNRSLLESLVMLGVDVKMVQRRQPGVLKRSFTNEQGLASFLQCKGASREVVASIISRFPRAISRSEEHLQERWQLWRQIFLSDGEIVNILARSPESFFRSSDNSNLERNIIFLGSLGLSSKDLCRLLTTAPRTFSNSLELNRQMVELLKDVCLSLGGNDPEHFVKAVLSRNLYILIRSTKRIKANIEFLQNTLALSNGKLLELLQGQGAVILSLSNGYLMKNFKGIQQKLLSHGCGKDDVKKLVTKYPPVLYISQENLKDKINCLQKGGVSMTQIIKKPKVLEFSIKNLTKRLQILKDIGYDFQKNGIGILDSSQRRFDAKLQRLSVE